MILQIYDTYSDILHSVNMNHMSKESEDFFSALFDNSRECIKLCPMCNA